MNRNSTESRKLSRRGFLQMAGVVGTGALLAACAAPQGATDTGGGESGATAEGATIAWWNQYSTETTKVVIPLIIAAFEEKYPGVTVDYEISGGPPGGGDYQEVLLTRIAAGNPPDSITLWTPPSQFGARGSLTAIDDFMATAEIAKPEAFYEGPLNSCKWQGSTYGLPASAGAGSIFINKDMFDEMGISTSREDFPTTWEGIKELSAQFNVDEGGEITRTGFVPWNDSWLKPVWSGLNGGQIFDADTVAYALDSAENDEWLTYWVNWLDEQYGGDIEQLNLYGSWAGVYPGSAFYEGITAMASEGSWATSDVDFSFEWEVMKFPVGPSGETSVTGYWPNWWAIPAGVTNAQEAFNFCEYFCTEGWETWYGAIMDTPAWRDFPADVLTTKLVEEQGQERAQGIHNFFAEYLNDAADMWNSPIEGFASDTLDAAIDEVLHKVKSPAEALATSQTLVQAKLEETLAS